jgi:hypothetical protein
VTATLITPPSIHSLMLDPVYAKFMKTIPRLPESISHGNPWQVWVQRDNGKWATTRTPTYRDAWSHFRRAYDNPDAFIDVAITSRRRFFGPPAHYVWDVNAYPWCPRCRRPSVFHETMVHHALKFSSVISSDEPYRCHFCGIRKAIVGTYNAHHG